MELIAMSVESFEKQTPRPDSTSCKDFISGSTNMRDKCKETG